MDSVKSSFNVSERQRVFVPVFSRIRGTEIKPKMGNMFHRKFILFFEFLLIAVAFVDEVFSEVDYQNIAEENFYRGFRGFDDFPERSQPLSFPELPALPVEDAEWQAPEDLGQISGVAVDRYGRPVVFHRADRVWGYNTFTDNNEYLERRRGAIEENTVLTLHPKTGKILNGWGNRTFYLPHGIHIDARGNVWLTDVALHQVFKYDSSGSHELTLGEAFEPGNDLYHFCQPTSVAVATTGEIIVADGYCNSRIIIFDSMGNPKYSIGEPWVHLRIPHGLTILPNGDTCVADRENSRIICLNVGLRSSEENSLEPAYSIRHRQFGRVFGITSYGNIIYAVDSMAMRKRGTGGFTIDPIGRKIIGIWGPVSEALTRPHAIAMDPNGTALYISEIGPNKLWRFNLLRTDFMK